MPRSSLVQGYEEPYQPKCQKIWLSSFMNCLYCLCILLTQLLSTWADMRLHVFLQKSSITCVKVDSSIMNCTSCVLGLAWLCISEKWSNLKIKHYWERCDQISCLLLPSATYILIQGYFVSFIIELKKVALNESLQQLDNKYLP